MHSPDPPKIIGRRYRVGGPLARGGMATVYRGHDEQLGRPVAIKVMHRGPGHDRRFLRRFRAEARRAASISHPNLVAVYDVGTDGGPYIVMELVEGGDLATAISRDGPMDPDRAAAIASQVAAALHAAHGAGLVHRDVKPGNILLGSDGRPRVTDFGIARATGEESLTGTGAILGSVDYFSPEQARGERATASSDVYALGVVLYEMLTGRRPFGGDTPYAVATARLREPVPDPRDANPVVPTELAAIAQRAMALDPDDRFASAAQLREALDAWRERHASSDAPPAAAALAPDGDRAPDRRWVIPVALLLLLMLAGGYVATRMLDPGTGGTPVGDALDIVVGTPGGRASPSTPSPEASPTETPADDPTASPAPTPTAVPRTPAPATPAPATPPPATPVQVAVAGSPDDAVAAFYGAVARGDFDAAYALWSDRMRASYPRQENLDGRFADTAEITFSQLSVAEQTASSATVQANFTERYDSGSTRRFVGYWRLVNVDGSWLLDEPNY